MSNMNSNPFESNETTTNTSDLETTSKKIPDYIRQ